MAPDNHKTRIAFFIGSLRSGGKERRLVELLCYLKSQGRFELLVVMTHSEIHYQEFYNLDIPYIVISKKWKRDYLSAFRQFFKVCLDYRPQLIHTWGRIQSLYALPAAILRDIPVINSQITGAPTKLSPWSLLNIIDRLNFHFSKVILANSQAGITSYEPPKDRRKVIYNGISLSRFQDLPDVRLVKERYKITTPYAVVMAASFTAYKDYNLFYNVASHVTSLRDDITFIGVGGCDKGNDLEYRRMLSLSSDNPRILFPGKIRDVEALVNACDVGVLFSPNGEGISNAILEYMALAKPVVATGTGGTKELIVHNENGYLIPTQAETEKVSEIITNLIDNPGKRAAFGQANRKIIEETFCLEKMGGAFEQVYREALPQRLTQSTTKHYRLNPS